MTMDAVAYKNGQKNNWGGREWNVLSKWTPDHANAVVLYLPGSEDADRKRALDRGFHPANLIAVETNAKVVRKLRAQAVTTINCSLSKVCEAWPAHTPVSILVADFQCGIEKEILDVVGAWLTNPAFSDCALTINLQRGRDKIQLPAFAGIQNAAIESGIHDKATNRALLLFMFTCAFVAKSRGMSFGQLLPQEVFRMHPLQSYRSSRVTMDSMILKKRKPIFHSKATQDKKTQRLIAAALALRTMRLSGRLACA